MTSTRPRSRSKSSFVLAPWLSRMTVLEYTGAAGLAWLLAYALHPPAREWMLGALWGGESWLAGALGLALRRPGYPASEPDRIASVAIIGLYCVAGCLLSRLRAHSLHAADELLSGSDMAPAAPRPGARAA